MTTTPDSPASKYLRRVAELNPMWRAADLVQLRSRAFKIQRFDKDKSKEAFSGDLEQLRNAYREYLRNIQAQFWQLPQPMLLEQISSIDTKHLPELVPAVQRLRSVAELRGQFPKLAQEPWMVSSLFQVFKTAVVLPQSDAGFIRERFTGQIQSKKVLTKLRKAVEKIQSDYPTLYALERDFFETLRKLKLTKRKSDSFDVGFDSSDFHGSFGWIGALFVFFIIRGLIVLVSRMSQ